MKVFHFSQEFEKEKLLEKKGKLTDQQEEALDGKCGGCNWDSDDLFILAKTETEAKKLLFKRYNGDGAGMCGNCFADYIASQQLEVNE